MQTLCDKNHTFPDLLQRLAVMMSEYPEDKELDGRTLSQCEEELGALRSIQEQLDRRVASVGRKRNTFASINALPPELLVTVFMFITHDDWSASYSGHATLSLVCYHWYHLVNDTPSLWTQIRKISGTSTASITRALEKSKNAPLEITCDIGWGVAKTEQTEFLKAVFPHVHRWKEANLWLEGESLELDSMATLSAPLLEYFSLSVNEHSGWAREEPLDIFGGRPPPKLRWLYLAGIPVHWNSNIFCQLTSFSISRILRLGPSVDQLLAVLSACPNLESLSIREVTFSGGYEILSSNPTHMPALNRVALCELPAATSNQILSTIRAPNCKYGELSCHIHGNPLETLFTSNISHFFGHMGSGVDAGSIGCNSDRIRITWIGSWLINLIVGDIIFAKDTINWLSGLMDPKSRAVALDLSIYGPQPPMVEETLAAVADMELLHRVTLGPDTAVAGALTLLATCSSVEGVARWPFPALEELWIDVAMNDDEWERLLHALRSRQGEPEGRGEVQQPKPLRKLEFRGDWYIDATTMINNFSTVYWPNRLDEIRRLLGPTGKLIWYGRAVSLEGVIEDAPAFQTWND